MSQVNPVTPPKLAEKLLLFFLKEDLAEEVLGDLDEKFYAQSQKYSGSKAKRNYWYQVFNYMRPFAFKFFRSKYSNKTAMIQHNFKVSYRQMLRNKAFSIINIEGLAMGMVVAMLIGLWVQDELNYNKYHGHYKNIVHVLRHEDDGMGGKETNSSMTTGLGALIKDKFPDMVDEVVMVRARTQNRVISYGQNKFRETGMYAQEGAPGLWSLEMLRGTQNGLKELESILLSESLSQKLFGDENPINKTIKINAGAERLVTGVYKDIPNNSKFNNAAFVLRLETLLGQKYMNTWSNHNVDVYLKLNPEIDVANFTALLNEAAKPNYNDYARETNHELFLHPMKDWHLKSAFKEGKQVTSSEMQFVWLYGAIGMFAIVLACINFMNLSTARSEKRAKEVGIKKTLGSLRKQLVFQFYTESLMYSLFAYLVSLALLHLLLPWFNETSGKEIALPWSNASFWVLTAGFTLVTGLLAGTYPAAYLSSFKPIRAIKGAISPGKNVFNLRRVLVVFQFTISIALIIGTITVNRQIQMAKSLPVGYTPKGMLSIDPATPNFYEKKETLRTEMLNTGMAVAVGSANYPVTTTKGWNPGFTWEGMDPGFTKSFNTISISRGYAEAVGMKFIAGRDFDESLATDKNAILINRSAMEEMQLENPVGTVVRYNPNWADPRNYTIIGVVEDMIKGSPFEPTFLSVMFLEQESTSSLYIRLNPDISASESIPVLEKVFTEIFPEAPFDYSFAEDDYNEKFKAEEQISSLASFFSILAIFISALGLFGLAAYIAEQRTKEIGIRKVLGASVLNLWKLLSKDFAVLVIISCIIAIPISYSVLEGWLAGYEIQTALEWWFFALGGIGGFLITITIVSYQTIKAALMNPVKSLRTE